MRQVPRGEGGLSNGEITTDIERFIHDNINSVEQLEILLLLATPPQQEWSALEASKHLYRQVNSVREKLDELRDRGLLSVRQDVPEAALLYSYTPNGRQDAIVQGLARAYQVRKDAVIRLIFNRPSDNLRAFSDAFRIRKDS